MPNRLAQFLSLSFDRKRLWLEAFVALARARRQLNRTPLKVLLSEFDTDTGPSQLKMANDEALASEIGWAIGSAAAHTSWDSTCLVQVLAAQKMLRSRGIGGEFCLGAARGGSTREVFSSDFAAHAWLTCGGQFVTGERDHQRYQTIVRYRWP